MKVDGTLATLVRNSSLPEVSVIIPCFNYAHYLIEAVTSVLNQTYQNFEIIIVNDGSTDNFHEVAELILSEYDQNKIKILSQKNAGQPAIVRNNGIKEAKGKYILCLDADDKIHVNFLEKCVNVLNKHTEYSIAYPNIQHFDNNTSLLEFDDYDESLIKHYNHIPTASLFKKKAWVESGGYKTNVKGYEDWDFWIGCYEVGHYGKHVKNAIFYYRVHDGGNLLKDANHRDRILKSQIIVNHKESYNSRQINWANKIQEYPNSNLISDPGLGLIPLFSQDIQESEIINSHKLTDTMKNIHCVFIIENLLGVTGGNNTLKKMIKYLIKMKLDISILTRTENTDPLDDAKIITVPVKDSFSKLCPDCDIVVATYFTHVHELLDIEAIRKVYYAQGDQFVFGDSELTDQHNTMLKTNLDLHQLSSLSYEVGNVITILNSKNLADTVMSKYGCRKPDYIVPVGTDLDMFYPAEKRKNEIEILVVGPDQRGNCVNPLKFKGIAEIKKALGIVKLSYPNIIVNRISNTPPDIFRDFDCAFFMQPVQNELAAIYRKSHILVYGSYYDSCPRPPQEGMASGCAVICTDTAGAREYCVNGVNSLLVKPGDVATMANAIKNLIRDEKLRNEISIAGIATSRQYAFDDECKLFYRALRGEAVNRKTNNENSLNVLLDNMPKPQVKAPDVAKIGNLSELKKTTQLGNNVSLNEFVELLKLRPFHPEAYLQLIDISLENNLLEQAYFLIKKLRKLCPKWELPENLYKSFNEKKLSNDNISTLLKTHCIESNRLTCCLITKNEEPNIGKCLKSLREVAGQVIVLDTGSEDDTKKIATSYGAEVYEHEWKDDFSEAKNKCLEYARGDWVLFLDADEELASGAGETLKEDMSKPNILGYRLPLKNVGSQLHGCNYVPRLIRNAPGLHFIGKIHETIHASVLVVMRQWNMEQVIGKTKILHHGYKVEELQRKNKLKRNLALYEEALEELPDEPSIMMNYAHDLNHDGQNDRAHQIYKKILDIFEQYQKEHITPEVREQFVHNYGVFLAQHLKMNELSKVMASRTAQETGPVANVHYMSGLGLMNCNKFRQAIPELEASIEKAYDDTLAPCVPDVRTWKPKHLLANCHASIGNELDAICLWDKVIEECNDSADPFHDYARFLSALARNKEALGVLLKGLKVDGESQKIWELGCGIVNRDPELAEMSLEWTEEAVKHHPESDVTNVRRGESLMKNGRFAEATDYFDRLSGKGEKTATAAQLICRRLSNQGNEQDLKIARGCEKEVNGWIDALDKAPCEFDRELAEQLIG